jgi:hypothetical protein
MPLYRRGGMLVSLDNNTNISQVQERKRKRPSSSGDDANKENYVPDEAAPQKHVRRHSTVTDEHRSLLACDEGAQQVDEPLTLPPRCALLDEPHLFTPVEDDVPEDTTLALPPRHASPRDAPHWLFTPDEDDVPEDTSLTLPPPRASPADAPHSESLDASWSYPDVMALTGTLSDLLSSNSVAEPLGGLSDIGVFTGSI